MRKRSLAALLACVMVISLLPTAALAAPPENVESAEGYRISSCTMNGEEKLGTTGPVQFTHLKAGDKILTEMETFQALDVVYISDSGMMLTAALPRRQPSRPGSRHTPCCPMAALLWW